MSNSVEESSSISNQYSPFLTSTLPMNIITKVNYYQNSERARVAVVPCLMKSLSDLALKIEVKNIAGRKLTIRVSPII